MYKPPGLQAVPQCELVLPAPEETYLAGPTEEIDSWKRHEVTKDSEGIWRAGTFLVYLSNI